MKQLYNVQDVWNYCLFCPLCQKNCRSIKLFLNAEYLKIIKYDKQDHILEMDCRSEDDAFETINLTIDCFNNIIETMSTPNKLDHQKITCMMTDVSTYDGRGDPNAYLSIHGMCPQCHSYVGSDLISLNFIEKSILPPFSIQREVVQLLKTEDKFHITLLHHNKSIMVSKYHEEMNGTAIFDMGKVFTYDMIDLNFSEPQKVISKIKTLLIFS